MKSGSRRCLAHSAARRWPSCSSFSAGSRRRLSRRPGRSRDRRARRAAPAGEARECASMLYASAYEDGFARDGLPPLELWPAMPADRPELAYPKRLNAAVELLDRRVESGDGARPCLRASDGPVWSYAELLDKAN